MRDQFLAHTFHNDWIESYSEITSRIIQTWCLFIFFQSSFRAVVGVDVLIKNFNYGLVRESSRTLVRREMFHRLDFSLRPVDVSSEPLYKHHPLFAPNPHPTRSPSSPRFKLRTRSASDCFGVGDGTDGWPWTQHLSRHFTVRRMISKSTQKWRLCHQLETNSNTSQQNCIVREVAVDFGQCSAQMSPSPSLPPPTPLSPSSLSLSRVCVSVFALKQKLVAEMF